MAPIHWAKIYEILGNTEAQLKKSVAHKKTCIIPTETPRERHGKPTENPRKTQWI